MGIADMGEIDCMDLAWAPATGIAERFAAAGCDDRAPQAVGGSEGLHEAGEVAAGGR